MIATVKCMSAHWQGHFIHTHDFESHILLRTAPSTDTDTYSRCLRGLTESQFKNFVLLFTNYLTKTFLITEEERAKMYKRDIIEARVELDALISSSDLNTLLFIYTMQYFMM